MTEGPRPRLARLCRIHLLVGTLGVWTAVAGLVFGRGGLTLLGVGLGVYGGCLALALLHLWDEAPLPASRVVPFPQREPRR